MNIISLTFQNMLLFLAFFLTGILLVRIGKVEKSASRVLSVLVTTIFLPLMSLNTFAQYFTIRLLGTYIVPLLTGIGIMLFGIPISRIIMKRFGSTRAEKLTVEYSMVVSNYGYIGYPLTLALFGPEMLTKYMMFALPFNFYAFCYELPQWMDQKDGEAPWKRLLTPPQIAIVLGMVYGLTGLKWPTVAYNICTSASNCVGPICMLVAGISLGALPIKESLTDIKPYVANLMRLIILPLLELGAAFLISKALHLDETCLRLVSLFAPLPIGLNPVIFAETNNKDGSCGARFALISMPLCLITLPLMMKLTEWLISLL